VLEFWLSLKSPVIMTSSIVVSFIAISIEVSNFPHISWLLLEGYRKFQIRFELTTLVVIGIDCIGSYKSNCYMTTTASCILLLTAFTKTYFVHKIQMFKFVMT
jgi:hypothetical protein